MNRAFTVVAVLISAVALYLPARSQTFTRVAVDGRAMRLLAGGDGKPAVVFESGLAGSLEHWGKVQPVVSRFARTVSYDRAGNGLSADGPRPRDGRRIAAELRQALLAAGIEPPYILVGASLGGPYVRIFAGAYPDEVAGIVLVDPTPDSERAERTGGLAELEAMADTLEQARASRIPAGIPLTLIDAISPLEVPFATEGVRATRLRNRAELEAESVEYRQWLDTIPGSRLVASPHTGHNVAQEQPAIVIATIQEVIAAARRR